MKYGLIGKTLSHSYSKAIHGFLGNGDYELLELEPEAVEGFLQSADFRGINVTIPYKETVMPYCTPDAAAEQIGSVNTVVNKNGKLHGYNTDYFGFSYMAKSAGLSFAGKKVVILGSGGTSKTAACVARDQNAGEIVVVSRNGENNYDNLCRHSDADVLINTTPVGMYPDNLRSPVSLSLFANLSAVIDVVYNPLRTKLVLEARGLGINTANGLAMLAAQALCAHNLFFGIELDENACDSRAAKVLSQTEKLFLNIVLIGMPGCGKTSLGRKLAGLFEMDFVDTDHMIEAETGRKPSDIIRENGEAFFRELERKAVSLAAAKTRRVIATGGGSVLARENRDALLQNGTILFLDMELKSLATADRPLSVDLEAMYRQRLPIYESLCHHKITPGKNLQETLDRVLKILS